MSKRDIGKRGEEIAARFLKANGYEILERNYTYEHGEIDIIAQKGNTLVFVEVKYRHNLEYGRPEAAISKKKIRMVKKTAEAYLMEKNLPEGECRIDVIAILELEKGKPEIEHYENVSFI
jgi:putative endonuclease